MMMKLQLFALISFICLVVVLSSDAQVTPPKHIFSTLFVAPDMNQYLSTNAGIDAAIQWCKQHGIVSKVYLESWRDQVWVDKSILINAKQRFEAAGYSVSGCVCTTKIGKPSTDWNEASCYTNTTTQQKLGDIFSFTASIFDEIIIDDFFFTDCECSECTSARASHTVTVDGHHLSYTDVDDASCYIPSQPCPWHNYRRHLMQQISEYAVLQSAKAANPNVTVIIKFPDWYDVLQDYGYDTAVQSAMFPKMWVGTESRDYSTSAHKPPYFGFFQMRWLGGIGGERCGGGWYDPFQCSPACYLEQARMTVLGGAKESFLFEYSSYLSGDGKADIDALVANQAELVEVSGQVRLRAPVGVAAYKPPNSHGGCIVDPQNSNQCTGETYVFDFLGMLGVPLLPTHQFPYPEVYPSAFFSTHLLRDADAVSNLQMYIGSGNPTLVTDGLKSVIGDQIDWTLPNIYVLPVHNDPPSLLSSPPSGWENVRKALLKPLGWQFTAPVNASIFPFQDGSWVVENFADVPVTVTINQTTSVYLDKRSWKYTFNN